MIPRPAPLRPSPVQLVTSAGARAAGVRLSDSAGLTRVRSGVYAPRADWERLQPWDRYLVRVHAFAQSRSDLPFAFESAAALRGLPLFGHPRSIHVFDARRARSLRYGDVTAHTSADARTFDRDGLAVTTLGDTLLDLARVLPVAFGTAVADAALRSDPELRVDDLRQILAERQDPRGRTRAALVLDGASAASESVGESVSRVVIGWCGFPRPVLQQTHTIEGITYRSDLSWPEHGVIGESDGWGKYRLDDPGAARRALQDEKRREDRLRRAGWRIARWTYADALAVAPLRTALLAAGLPLVHAPDAARLQSVARNPRSAPT